MLDQRHSRWASISPALAQCLVFAETGLSQVVTHSGEATSKDGILTMCWFNVGPLSAGPTLNQHKVNVKCLLGGAPGANRSVTIQLDEG